MTELSLEIVHSSVQVIAATLTNEVSAYSNQAKYRFHTSINPRLTNGTNISVGASAVIVSVAR